MKLRELHDLSTQETAGILGLSVGTVKARVFHGQQALGSSRKVNGISPTAIELAAVYLTVASSQ